MKTTLIAVTGLSPAIVTETLWALAQRTPAIYPEKVVFITTATGFSKIREQLFTPRDDWKGLTVWDALRKAINAPEFSLIADSPAIITMANAQLGQTIELDDIRTPEENISAAEFIFSQVWNVVRHPSQQLIASVAGGRKTMGALLHSAVSLIGRENDLITHILVEPPFDALPGFFFPGQPGGALLDRSGKKHPTKNANPILADVPFVPLRNRFKELNELPSSFLELRDQLANTLSKDAQREAVIKIQYNEKKLTIDGKKFPCSLLELAVLEFVLRSQIKKQSFTDQVKAPQQLAAETFVKWAARNRHKFPGLKVDEKREARLITHPLNSLRKKLKNASWQPAKFSFSQAPFVLEVLV